MTGLVLQEIHDFAVKVAKDAGMVIMKASNSRLSSNVGSMSEKKNCPFLPIPPLSFSCGPGHGN